MMFPIDRPLYVNLNTSFTDFDQLLADLASKRLTGYVSVRRGDYSGALLLSSGEVVNAIETGREQCSGKQARQGVSLRAREKDGSVSVYELSPEIVGLLVRVIDAEPIFRDLTTAFTSLEKLVEKLEAEHHTGYIEATLGAGRGLGMIYFEDGVAVEAILSAEGESVSGVDVVDTVLKAAASVGASFNVYRVNPSVAADFVADEPPAEEEPEFDQSDVLPVWQDILNRVEEVVDQASGRGRFGMAFKEVCVERAMVYPFLDPFAAEFEYRDGHVSFYGTPPSDLSAGLGDCLRDTIARLSLQLRRSDLESKIRDRLRGLGEQHAGLIDRFELTAATADFLT